MQTDTTASPVGPTDDGERPDRLYTFRLPSELHAALKARAKQEDRRLAQTVRAALRNYLAR